MGEDILFRQLTEFFKAARHLWGRCPRCGELFRLSAAAISFGSEPPKDWLRKVQQQQGDIAAKKGELDDWQADIEGKEYDVQVREREIHKREQKIHLEAKALALQMLKEDRTIKQLVKQEKQEAVQRSRSTLLGKLFERLAPFIQRFHHDPRDIRALMDPIDYVCFDGLTINRRVERITFVEVKSGTSKPSQTQQSIIRAVQDGRVETEVWHFGERRVSIPQQLRATPGLPPALPSRQNDGRSKPGPDAPPRPARSRADERPGRSSDSSTHTGKGRGPSPLFEARLHQLRRALRPGVSPLQRNIRHAVG